VLRSYVTLTHADIGFDPGPHTYDVQFYPLPPGRANDAVAKVRAIPGVTAVAASDDVPYANFTQNFTSVHVPSRPKDPAPMVEMIDADASYFDVMGMSLLRGRAISAQDRMSSSPVAIVNESFARSVLHASSPLGVHIVPDTYAGPHAVTRTIVGVVADIRDSRSQAPQPQIYVPLAQIGDPSQLVVRTNGNDAGLASAIQRIFEQADRENPPPVVVSFAGLFAQDTSAARGNTALFGGLALIALVLALAGMYAVAAYSAQRRTHEFGIRKAVGASDSAVLRNVLRASLAQMLAGICIGLILAAVGVRFLSGILYETSPLDPPTFLLVVVLFGACASTAALVPAMRAMRVNPVVALRYE
jgi:ABC-type antimicrobial peptide transport system permease subunit